MKMSQILEITQILSKLNQGNGGECGNFAVALKRILGEGTLIAIFDSYYQGEGYHHVVLKVGRFLYDHSGRISRKDMMNQYAYDENYDDVKFWTQEVDEESAIRRTDEGDEETVKKLIFDFYKIENKQNQLLTKKVI